jgi:filamentous hemagglutinin family protein
MFVKCAALLCALFSFAAVAAASDAMVLAAGKSVSVVDAEDPSIQVVVTAPADQPLDLGSLLSSAGPKESVYSIVTRMQVNAAGALVQAADGSISLGTPPAALLPPANITGGLIVFQGGRYAHYSVAPALAVQTAGRPGEQLMPVKDDVPVVGRIAGPAPVLPAAPAGPMAASLPTGGQVIAGGAAAALPISQTALSPGIINWQSFTVGSGGSVTFGQSATGSVTLTTANGGQTPIVGNVTSNAGQIQLTAPTSATIGSVKAVTTGASTPGGTTFTAR